MSDLDGAVARLDQAMSLLETRVRALKDRAARPADEGLFAEGPSPREKALEAAASEARAALDRAATEIRAVLEEA